MRTLQGRTARGRSRKARLAGLGGEPTEHESQVALFTWAALMCRQYPELRALYAVPNAGKRVRAQGAWMVAEGLRKGMLDVCLPAARGGYNALYIEMKAGKNDTTPEQDQWVDLLDSLGNLCVICWGFEAARIAIVNYLEGNLRKP